MKKGYEDLKTAYREISKAYPGETAVFCCDLGSAWLFKFKPNDKIDDLSYVDGHFGVILDKESGKVGGYDMLKNMAQLKGKVNLAPTLK